MFSLIRPAVFKIDPEKAHRLAVQGLKAAGSLGVSGCLVKQPPRNPVTVMGIQFPNPVGLAAGLDKNGDCIDGLAGLGFGFLEIGTVTPLPQPGNPQPRLFRLPQAQAIINRMGFNNDGVDKLVENVLLSSYRGILGINIGKNAVTPIENAVEDYLFCMRKVYQHASYITVNISSPNTKNLRELQGESALDQLLKALKQEQKQLADSYSRYVPLALKIAPDLASDEVRQIAALLVQHNIDGVIATNTTLSREEVAHLKHGDETGGLSGAPVKARSTEVIQQLAIELQGALPIIGVGGILSGADAVEKINAGASLVQVYSGLIYRGPELVHECATAIQQMDTD